MMSVDISPLKWRKDEHTIRIETAKQGHGNIVSLSSLDISEKK